MVTKEEEKEMQGFLDKKQYWWWADKARTTRLSKLRSAVWFKGARGSAYIPGVKIDPCGCKIYTDVFQSKDPVEPGAWTRAKADAAVLDRIPIFVIDDARIVGYCGAAPNVIFWIPYFAHAINEDLYNDRSGLFEEKDREWIKKDLDWWRPRTYQAACERILTRKEKMESALAIITLGQAHLNGFETAVFDHEWAFKGYGHIINAIDAKVKEARDRLQGIGELGPNTFPMNAPEDLPLIEKLDNLQAMKWTMEASVRWIKRYSRLAKILAENFETNPERKIELMRIHETCAKIATEPPEHIWESIQHHHFLDILKRYECSETAWPSRPDFYHWPFYKKDVIDEKNIARDDVIDYIGEWQLRTFETNRPWSRLYREIMTGGSGPLVWTIGGVDPETGEDACSDLTDDILTAARLTRTSEPTYGFRWHSKARPQTLRQVFECIRHGLGYPSIRHDEILIQNMMTNYGYSVEEARTWVHAACMSPACTTKETAQPIRYGNPTIVSSPAMSFAIFDGWDPVTKMQAGHHTGDVTTFDTWEKFYNAWIKQLQYIYWTLMRGLEKDRWIRMKQYPRVWISAMYERCVDAGLSCDEVKEHGNPWMTTSCHMDQFDGLVAVKKLIYDEKKYTWAQLRAMLLANWEGYERERMDFIRVPKWGNDDSYCDDIIVKAHKDINLQTQKPQTEWCGNSPLYLPENVSVYVVCSTKIGAQPNGRRWGDTLYDGGCSPGAGLDKKGPTAVLRSVGKLDHVRDFKATLLNQRLNPTQLAGEKGVQLFMGYMRAWHDLGIDHVQFNMVDNETLRAAQKEPEKYPELMVRVAGYSAHFVELSRKCQDTIMARTVQEI